MRLVNVQPGENIIVIKDLDNLKPGMYLLEIITTDGKITQKIVK
ncbi:MAG: T9SS type A sorting domain-containing protein [Chitinophagaceae bacterium]|nr:T9SS type A sorting domain-containing protein [Chitinophagaceae bacterium]